MSTRLLGMVLGALILLQLGILVGQTMPPAWAQDTPSGSEAPEGQVFRDPPRLLCKMFTVPLDGAGSMFETNDLNTEIGRWIQSEEDLYDLFSIDFEVGQKATGYPQGYAQVCLSPR
jgi:hypothetical protein